MIRANDREFLQKIPFFKDLAPEQLADLYGKIVTTVHSKGTMIFKQGDEADALFMVRHGYLDIFRGDSPANYNAIFLCSLEAGSYCGEFSLLGPSKRLTTAVVGSDAHLLQLTRHSFEELAEQDPRFGFKVLQAVARQLMVPFQEQPEFFFQAIRNIE